MERYDVVVSGAGPAGSAAAWQAATSGARVLLCDRASFPRDKPCGDGLTPRAVHLLTSMGLGAEVDRRFHKVDRFRVTAYGRQLDRPWPARPGLPSHGYVAPRTDLDTMLVEAAVAAGATLRTGVDVLAPVVEDGTVTGVRLRDANQGEQEVHGAITIAAEGMSSRLCKALGMVAGPNDTFAVAVRAQVASQRPDDRTLELLVNLQHGDDLLPGYGWVFPMGDGRINLGIGYMSSYAKWREVKARDVMETFAASLPEDWKVPDVQAMVRSEAYGGWRLPLGLTIWPPWRPGLMAAGDAVGAAKPFTGVGISKALQSGMIAGQTAVNALAWGDPRDLMDYEREIDDLWGSYYRLGRQMVRLLGKPKVNRAIVSTGLRAGAASEFLTTMFMGNGDLAAGSGISSRLGAAATRAARVGGGRPVDGGSRIAEARRPVVASRRPAPP